MPSFTVPEPIGDQQAGTSISLTVDTNLDATLPIQYQWLRNNIAIPGAVDVVYNFIVTAEDGHASYTVFVQNPCGSEISKPSIFGEVPDQPFCKYYECDAFSNAIVAAGPWAYFPCTNVDAGLDPDNQTGGQLVDSIGSNNVRLETSFVFLDVDAPSSLNNCSGTSYYGGNLLYDSINVPGTPTVPGNTMESGSIIYVCTLLGETDVGAAVDIHTDGTSGESISLYNGGRRINTRHNSGDVNYDTLIKGFTPIIPGAWITYATCVTWQYNGDGTTTFEVTDYAGDMTFTVTRALRWDPTVAGSPGRMDIRWNGCYVQDIAYYNYKVDAAALMGELQRTLTTYVDPNPLCIGAPCKTYECDAYETAMVATFDHLWPLHEDAPPTVVTDIIGAETLTLAGTTAEGLPILADQCGGGEKSYKIGGGAAPYFRNTGYGDSGTGLVGGFGVFSRSINFLSMNTIVLRFNGSSTKTVGLTFFGDTAVSVAAFGNQQDTQINIDVDSKYVWVNYTMAADGLDLTYEVFVDWVSAGTGTITQTQTEAPTLPVTWVGLGGGGGSGFSDVEFFGIKNSHVSAEQVATLKDALSQNQVGYVDPDPNCRPPA